MLCGRVGRLSDFYELRGNDMATRKQISYKSLKRAFASAERMIADDRNHFITKVVTNEVSSLGVYEPLINAVIARALYEELSPRFVVETEVNRIDICAMDNSRSIVIAIESKGMVSNSTNGRGYPANSLDVHGIKTRKLSEVEKDINGLENKVIKNRLVVSHHEIVVPIVYELYRSGGEGRRAGDTKPWTTPPAFRNLSKYLKRDLRAWFDDNYPGEFKPIHATKAIPLIGANELWQEQSAWHYPNYKSLEAYVSFFAFGRYVEE